jgi:nucleotide-binding universal stress UspA family protein
MRKIVVGVDGSVQSLDALRWAVDEARRRGAGVEAVYAWSLPHVSTMHEALHVLDVDLGPMREAARTLLETAVEKAGPGRDVALVQLAVEGPASVALLAAAQDADLLVVGSRGLGGFKGLLLGSVGQQLAHHAPCPVVVVRPPAG